MNTTLYQHETLRELGYARTFSKLDANCEYWQMKVNPDSYHFTTFINHLGGIGVSVCFLVSVLSR